MISQEKDVLILGSVILGHERISLIAKIPPESKKWGDAEMAELRDLGVSVVCVPNLESFRALEAAAKAVNLPMLVSVSSISEVSAFPEAAGFWVEDETLLSGSIEAFRGKPVFFCGTRFSAQADAFLDSSAQIGLYPSWKNRTSPWGLFVAGESLDVSQKLLLAGCTTGAQLLALNVPSPQSLEPLVAELKSFAAVLGRELTRIPKKTEAKAERGSEEAVKTRYSGHSKSFKVGFQGEHGAYSEMAVFNLFPKNRSDAVPFKTFREVFSAVLSGDVDFGMLPIENALAGAIDENFDLLLEFPDLHIVGETQVRVEHNLIGMPGTPLSAIKRVLSHPQGLAQSRQFLDSHPEWEPVSFYDTAGSVAHVAQTGDSSLAAIASAEAARYYGMEILVPGVETNHRNFTRFFLIAPLVEDGEGEPNKASVVFATADEPGALSRCLAIFAAHGVNMKKLESRPIHGRPWDYKFYVDVELPKDRGQFDRASEELGTVAQDFRLLGIYRA